MQILSKFCHNKLLYDNFVLSGYFTITMHKCVVIQQCYLYFKKQVVIHKKYYYKLKG